MDEYSKIIQFHNQQIEGKTDKTDKTDKTEKANCLEITLQPAVPLNAPFHILL